MIGNMLKRLCLILAGLALSFTICAQQSDSKKINSIKRNTSYLYAEATMDTEEEAFKTAKESLMTYIREYIESKKSLNNANNVIVKDVANRCEKLQMMRGDMYRVLVYVKKDDILPADNGTVISRSGETEQPDTAKVSVPDAGLEQKDTVSVPPVPVNDGLPSVSEINSLPNAFDDEDSEASDLDFEMEEVSRLETAWQQNVIDELLKASSLTEAKAMLNRFKTEFRVKRYGSYNECRSVAEAFWLIVEHGGGVKAVLGPGANERANYKTMRMDRLGNYSGYDAIWFTLAK